MIRTRTLLALTLLGATGLCGAVIFEGGPDTVIFPRQTIPLFFNHDYHVRVPDEAKKVTGEGLDCDFCHENISESQRSSDRDIPGHDGCDGCHDEWIGDEDEPAARKDCARCHKDIDLSVTGSVAASEVSPFGLSTLIFTLEAPGTSCFKRSIKHVQVLPIIRAVICIGQLNIFEFFRALPATLFSISLTSFLTIAFEPNLTGNSLSPCGLRPVTFCNTCTAARPLQATQPTQTILTSRPTRS